MRKIFLYHGRGKNKKMTDIFVLVNEDDYLFLTQWKWGYMKLYHCNSPIIYARRFEFKDKKTSIFLMHREVLKLTDRKIKCDHIDGNTLNNQKINLRICSHAQNMSNRIKRTNSASPYLGVIFNKNRSVWNAVVKNNGRITRSKGFKTDKEAALAYNEIALNLKGNFAKLNKF